MAAKSKKKRLEELEFYKRHGIPVPNEENDLQKECESILKKYRELGLLDYLHLNGGSGRSGKLQKSGEPDLIIYGPDKNTFFIELKAKTGKLRESQLINQQLKESLGYKVYLVRNIDDFKEIIKKEQKNLKITL